MARPPDSLFPQQDSVSNQKVAFELIESLSEEELKATLYKLYKVIAGNSLTGEEFCNILNSKEDPEAVFYKLYKAVGANNLTVGEFYNKIQAVYHSLLTGKFTELPDSVPTKTEPDQKEDVRSKKKMKPRGFSPKK